MTVHHVPHSMNWPASWRYRFALRALALDIASHNAAPPTASILARASKLVSTWQDDDPAALRRAERAFVAALFRDLARIDGLGPRWMRLPRIARRLRRNDGAA